MRMVALAQQSKIKAMGLAAGEQGNARANASSAKPADLAVR